MARLIVGLDTKSKAFHWVASDRLLDDIGSSRFGWVSSDQGEEEARLRLFKHAEMLFHRLPEGSLIFCEEPLALAKNPATTRKLCMAAGAIQAGFFAANPDAWWFWVDPASWKKEILGRGAPPRGTKHKPWIREQLLTGDASVLFRQWLIANGDAVAFDQQPDLFDAWCLMRHGMVIAERRGL